jgi:hypothetical protein
VKVAEIAIAVVLTLAGLRSLWIWSRRRFEGADVVDHLLYALYLTGRIGLWFALAGFFVIYASVDTPGVPGLDALRPYRWYVLVPLFLGALQLVAGWFLGHREPSEPG